MDEKKRILIADDDEHIVKLLARRLKEENYDVIAAYDAVNAVAKARSEKPDLILLDLKMPAGGGLNVFESLKLLSNTVFTPVIFMTGFPNPELQEKIKEMGATDFIVKPFGGKELFTKVKKALGEPVKHTRQEGAGDGSGDSETSFA
ncbi:MAG: response regulator [Candidatus Omnitrophica bacterium]|nr:response regulator [Candidatus Omnitrophota bacterium]